MILKEKYTLSNGVNIPKLGLGTWFISDETVAQAVKDAVTSGTGILIPRRLMAMKEESVKALRLAA
ncbi:MAG: hypothetical protein KIT80_08895 [Chitinophagaceae bacterium]|nr:hypothetical protein [Chitinophagaceae bacterium]MCW5927013.1 hypothetical protein [Chitinophagaceae bacterium]